MRALLFPGQGSQRAGMGADLFGRFPDLVAQADDVLGYSIRDVCLNNPDARLDRTEVTQPAVYVVAALRHHASAADTPAKMMAGHSLGEYVALYAAGAFAFADGLRMVQERGRLMGEISGGGLVAIVGFGAEQVERLLLEDGLAGVEIANINSPEQVVVGGRKDRLQTLLETCRARSIRAVPLRVSGAFHTSHMRPAAEKFERFLSGFDFAPLKAQVLSNVTGEPHERPQIKDRLVEQIARPVLWVQCIETMLKAGVDDFVEMGSPPILAPMVATIRRYSSGESKPTALPEVPAARPQQGSSFCRSFRCARPLVAGSLGHGVAGVRLVQALTEVGVLALLDTEGLELSALAEALCALSESPQTRGRFGASVAADPGRPEADAAIIDLLLRHGVGIVEARGFPEPSEALLRYRAGQQAGGATGTRVVARVATAEAASAFLRGSPLSVLPQNGTLPETSTAPWADAICVDLQVWRSQQGAKWQLFESLLAWRDAYRATGAGKPFFVGISGMAAEDYSASLAMGADYACAGALYLLAEESALDEKTKQFLRNGEGTFEELPDWHFPELGTKSLSFVRSPELGAAALALQDFYFAPHASAERLAKISSGLNEPFGSRLRQLAEQVSGAQDQRARRARIRNVARDIFFPGIIACDTAIAREVSPHNRRREHVRDFSAATLTQLYYPIDRNEGQSTEKQHGQ
jgi:trans-AT polyketide synthase, acyltransferase and oxidoreductase domains